MNRTNSRVWRAPFAAVLAGTLFSLFVTELAGAATVFHQFGAGGGSQVVYAPTDAMSGVMQALVPRFNPLLGTLIQADFEFAASANVNWYSVGNPTGTATLAMTGPADVDGQPMGNITLGFTGIYTTNSTPNGFDLDFANVTFTSGAYFNTLTGPGSVLMSYNYTGTTSLDTPAIPVLGGFQWGGSVHVLYTYDPVPEPSTLVLGSMGLMSVACVVRRKRASRQRG